MYFKFCREKNSSGSTPFMALEDKSGFVNACRVGDLGRNFSATHAMIAEFSYTTTTGTYDDAPITFIGGTHTGHISIEQGSHHGKNSISLNCFGVIIIG
jgi:hypothetical protein